MPIGKSSRVASICITHAPQDAGWAHWLAHHIRTFKVPRHTLAKLEADGVAVQRRITEVYTKDQYDDGGTGHARWQEKLSKASHLVVICSPYAAGEPGLSAEVGLFNTAHGSKNVLAWMVEGVENDILPSALKVAHPGVNQGASYPLGGDVRRSSPDSKRRAFTRLMAGVLDVDFDALWDRLRRERQLWQAVLSVMAVLLALAGTVWWHWSVQRRATHALSAAAHALRAAAEEQLAQGEAAAGAAVFAKCLRLDAPQSGVAERLADLLARRSWLLPATPSIQLLSTSAGVGELQVAWDARGNTCVIVHDGEFAVWQLVPSVRRLAQWRTSFKVGTLALSPECSRVAAWGYESGASRISLWDATTGNPIGQPVTVEGGSISLAFSPNGHRLLVAGTHLPDWIHRETLTVLIDAQKSVRMELPAPALLGASLVGAGADGRCCVSDGKTAVKVLRWPDDDGLPVVESTLPGSPDVVLLQQSELTGVVLVGTALGFAVATPVLGKTTARQILHKDAFDSAAAISPDGLLVAAAAANGQVLLSDVWRVGLRHQLGKPGTAVSALSFASDGRCLLTANAEGEVWLWDTATGEPLTEGAWIGGNLAAARFVGNGRTFCTLTVSGELRLWEARPRGAKALRVWTPDTIGDKRFFDGVGWTHDGSEVWFHREGKASVGLHTADGREVTAAKTADQAGNTTLVPPGEMRTSSMPFESASARQPAGPKHARVPTGHPNQVVIDNDPAGPATWVLSAPVTALAFTPGGERLAVVTAQGEVSVRDLRSQRTVTWPPLKSDGMPRRVAFDVAGRRLLVASESDQTHVVPGILRAWDAAAGLPLSEAWRASGPIGTVAIRPAGDLAVILDDGLTATTWWLRFRRSLGEPRDVDDGSLPGGGLLVPLVPSLSAEHPRDWAALGTLAEHVVQRRCLPDGRVEALPPVSWKELSSMGGSGKTVSPATSERLRHWLCRDDPERPLSPWWSMTEQQRRDRLLTQGDIRAVEAALVTHPTDALLLAAAAKLRMEHVRMELMLETLPPRMALELTCRAGADAIVARRLAPDDAAVRDAAVAALDAITSTMSRFRQKLAAEEVSLGWMRMLELLTLAAP